jgi:hypothetical protein
VTTICEKCHAVLEVGSFPFCPHGNGFSRVAGDETDYVDHNLGPEPIRIRSWSQRRALMAARGLQDYQYDVPVPDGMQDNKQRPSRWGAYRRVDADQMAWLAARLATGKAEKAPEETMTIRLTETVGDPRHHWNTAYDMPKERG